MASQKMIYLIIAENFFKKSKASYIGSHKISDVNVELGIHMLFYGF